MFLSTLATPSVDYTAPPPLLQAQASVNGPDMSLCFDVPIVDDDFVEFEECFGVSISLGNDTAGLMVSIADGQASSLCCIQDDDSKCITLTMRRCMEYSVNRNWRGRVESSTISSQVLI